MRYLSQTIWLFFLFFSFFSLECEAGALRNQGEGTVLDDGTGLLWQKDEGGNKTWQEALTYCETLQLGGEKWRLPNSTELSSLVDPSREQPALDKLFFANVHSNNYWSSTSLKSYSNYAWAVNFMNGYTTGVEKVTIKEKVYVRCVRG